MNVRLKPLNQQTIVITGASSGIGLSTARMAAKRGAKLVLAARTEEALRNLSDEINNAGGQAIAVPVDVADREAVARLSLAAVERFGGYDTWINDAGVSIYGRLDHVSLDDARRLFDTNFWGVVNGSLVAADYLRTRGGAVVNVGSTVSDRAIPLQGFYSASKHAVKGFTDALRMELEQAGAPVAVTLIKPGSIDTPFPHHAKNYMDVEPTLPPPVYAPEVVADAILYCCETPMRDLLVGGGGKMISAMGKQMPRGTDKYMEKTMFRQQRTDQPAPGREDRALYRGMATLEERGGYDGHVAKSSMYTKSAMHPITTGAIFAAGAALVAGALLTRDRD